MESPGVQSPDAVIEPEAQAAHGSAGMEQAPEAIPSAEVGIIDNQRNVIVIEIGKNIGGMGPKSQNDEHDRLEDVRPSGNFCFHIFYLTFYGAQIKSAGLEREGFGARISGN
jgi:hypothetical protein